MNEFIDGFEVKALACNTTLVKDKRIWASCPTEDWERDRDDTLARARQRYEQSRA